MTVSVVIPKMKIEKRLVSKKRQFIDEKTSRTRIALIREKQELQDQLDLANSRIQLQEAIMEEYKTTMKRQTDQIAIMGKKLADQREVICSQDGRIRKQLIESVDLKIKMTCLKNNVKDLLKMIGPDPDAGTVGTQTEETQHFNRPAKRLFEDSSDFWDNDFSEDYKLVINQ